MVTGSWGRGRYEVDSFLQKLGGLGPPSSAFLAGPELLLRDEILLRLRTAVEGDGVSDSRWGRESHSARETPLAEVLGGLRVVGLFSESRLIVVSEIERYGRASQTDRTDLWQWLEQPCEGVHLVLTSEKPLWELERGNEFLKGTLQRIAAVVRLEHPTVQGAVMLIRRIGKERYGLDIPAAIAARLVEAIGPNLLELRQEIERLSIRLGPGATVDAGMLENWLRGGIVGTLNDLERALLERDVTKALRYWDALRPVMNVPTVTWMLGNRHLDPRWRRGGEGASSEAFLSRVLHECYALERAVKTGEVPSSLQETAFEEMIWRLCGPAATPQGSGREIE